MPHRRWPAAVVLAFLAAVVAGAAWVAMDSTRRSTEGPSADFTPAPITEDRIVSLWVGDSYTAGSGGISTAMSQACQTARAMNWLCNVDYQGGTGYVQDGNGALDPSYTRIIDRLPADKKKYRADILVIDAGRNDGPARPELEAAIHEYLAAARKTYPKATIVAIAPYFVGSRLKADPAIGDLLREAMKPYGGRVIDPVREGWISPEATRGMVADDQTHPNARGHAYIARHLTSAMRRLGLPEGEG